MWLDAKYSATLKTKVESSSETMLHGVTLPTDSHLHNNVFSYIRFQLHIVATCDKYTQLGRYSIILK